MRSRLMSKSDGLDGEGVGRQASRRRHGGFWRARLRRRTDVFAIFVNLV